MFAVLMYGKSIQALHLNALILLYADLKPTDLQKIPVRILDFLAAQPFTVTIHTIPAFKKNGETLFEKIVFCFALINIYRLCLLSEAAYNLNIA